jgi:hypothetical protein
MSKSYSPVLISVYNRLDHLKTCIDSLRRNPISSETDLYVVSDAASKASDELKIRSVREYIGHVQGFKNVSAINRERNWGSFLSVKNSIDDVIGKYGKIIFLEDDNIVSPNFLNFLNDGLDFYQDDISIFSISAYNFPIEIPKTYKNYIYKWQGFNAWGVGFWESRWKLVDWNLPGIKELRKARRRLDQVAEHLYWLLLDDIEQNKVTIDAIVSYYIINKKLYSIFPLSSKVRNTGHEGSGEHCGVDEQYSQQAIDSGAEYQLIKSIEPDERINRLLWKNYHTPLKTKLSTIISGFLPPPTKKWIKRKFLTNKQELESREERHG